MSNYTLIGEVMSALKRVVTVDKEEHNHKYVAVITERPSLVDSSHVVLLVSDCPITSYHFNSGMDAFGFIFSTFEHQDSSLKLLSASQLITGEFNRTNQVGSMLAEIMESEESDLFSNDADPA